MTLRETHAKNSLPEVFLKNGFLGKSAKFTGKHLCQSLFFNEVTDLRPATLLKETLAQLLSCEFCEISRNTFLYRTPPVAASAMLTLDETPDFTLHQCIAMVQLLSLSLISIQLKEVYSEPCQTSMMEGFVKIVA